MNCMHHLTTQPGISAMPAGSLPLGFFTTFQIHFELLEIRTQSQGT